MNNRAYGTIGEKEAMSFLEKNGYVILARNFRVGRLGEIDIIARQDDCLCFIEVKTRSSNIYGTPAQAISKSKQNNIIRIANLYLQKFNLNHTPVRFDVVELIMNRDLKVKEIKIIKNAF